MGAFPQYASLNMGHLLAVLLYNLCWRRELFVILKKHSIRIFMPYISIECGTLTAVQKQNLIEQLTEAAVETTGIPKQFFMVSIKELPDDSIGIGGRSIDRIKKEYGNDEAAG